jgi:predicted transposase YbfD/YdcC
MNIIEHLKIIDQADLPAKRKNQTHPTRNNRHIIFRHTSKRTRPRRHRNLHRTPPKRTANNIHPQTRHPITRHHQTSLHHARPNISTKIPTPLQRTLKQQRKRKTQKIFAIDGKTQRGNQSKTHKPNHIVSAVDENGYCLSQKLVDEKSNEISAIPELLDNLNVKGHIITLDAMGTQREIVRKIRKKRADYVLALKANQKTMYLETSLCFDDPTFLANCQYCKTVEKARGVVEVREYWQPEAISSLSGRRDWVGLQSIAMAKNTVSSKDGTVLSVQTRYFISSLFLGAAEVARAIRGHWVVESVHWHLDVTFREDMDHTLDEFAAYNLNILRKLALNFLKLVDVGKKYVSLRRKRYIISFDLSRHVEQLLTV